MIVMPHSRTKIVTVTHHGSSLMIDKPMKAMPVSALSAIGSASLPKRVMMLCLRARYPSRCQSRSPRRRSRPRTATRLMRMDQQHPREDRDQDDAERGQCVRHIPRTCLRFRHGSNRMRFARRQGIGIGLRPELSAPPSARRLSSIMVR